MKCINTSCVYVFNGENNVSVYVIVVILISIPQFIGLLGLVEKYV